MQLYKYYVVTLCFMLLKCIIIYTLVNKSTLLIIFAKVNKVVKVVKFVQFSPYQDDENITIHSFLAQFHAVTFLCWFNEMDK